MAAICMPWKSKVLADSEGVQDIDLATKAFSCRAILATVVDAMP